MFSRRSAWEAKAGWIVGSILLVLPMSSVVIAGEVSVSTNTTAQRFSMLTVEEKLSYLDGVMDSMSLTHAVSGGSWICPQQGMAVYLLLTEKAMSTYSASEGPRALLKPAAFYALLAQQALGCQAGNKGK